jgi:hypothetical protein
VVAAVARIAVQAFMHSVAENREQRPVVLVRTQILITQLILLSEVQVVTVFQIHNLCAVAAILTFVRVV